MTKKKSKALIVVLIVLAVVLALVIGGAAAILGYISDPSNAFGSEEPQQIELTQTPSPTPVPAPEATEQDETEEPTATPEPTVTPEPTMAKPDYEFDRNRVSVLLLGADSSVERVNAGMNFRTDTMILVTADFETGKVDMISIPRDSYVRIYNKNEDAEPRFNKINSAFTFGGGADKHGYEYAMKTVSDLLGVRVDYYVGFGMNVVKEVVDAMGGVYYDVDIEFTMNGRETQKGYQHMDGQKVLDYCRFRKGGRGDVDRVDRQQRILFAMFEQVQAANQIKNIPEIYTAVQENVDTNLDLMQIATLAYFAKDVPMEDIERHTVPGNGQYVGDRSYYIIDQEKKNKMVKEIFGKEGPVDPDITVEAIEARIALENGWATEGSEQNAPTTADPIELSVMAEEWMVFIQENADMETESVQRVYEDLQNAIWSGEADRMIEAILAAQRLLPSA